MHLLEQDFNRRVSKDINLKHDISGPSNNAILELEVVVRENVGQGDLDLVAGKEAARTGVVAETELHAVVRWAGELELVCVFGLAA